MGNRFKIRLIDRLVLCCLISRVEKGDATQEFLNKIIDKKFGGEVVEIYFNRAKGVGKSEVCIVAHEDIKILGPHVVVKQEEELKEKFPYILANDRIWKKKINEQQEKLK